MEDSLKVLWQIPNSHRLYDPAMPLKAIRVHIHEYFSVGCVSEKLDVI